MLSSSQTSRKHYLKMANDEESFHVDMRKQVKMLFFEQMKLRQAIEELTRKVG